MLTNKAMGLIFPNAKDDIIPAMTAQRTMASLPFGGRYRLIDFALSSMKNSGIEKVGIIVHKNYLSLMKHVGTGGEWDLARKRSGVTIFPPNSGGKMFEGKVESIYNVISYLKKSKEEFVILSDCDLVCNLDYEDIVEKHIENGADVSVVYRTEVVASDSPKNDMVFELDNQDRVTEILKDDCKTGTRNISMNVQVISRELLIDLIQNAYSRGYTIFERDVLASNLNIIKVKGYKYEGYCSRIQSLKGYYDANMALLQPENLKSLFLKERPVYTKVRDSAPVIYTIGCDVKNSLISDGCIIEGEVENSVIFRGVKVSKGAKVKNSVLMHDVVVEEGAVLQNIVSDKDVVFTKDVNVSGSEDYPMFIEMGEKV